MSIRPACTTPPGARLRVRNNKCFANLTSALAAESTCRTPKVSPCAALHQVSEAWGADVEVVIAGLTNTYSSYITTWEEYQVCARAGCKAAFNSAPKLFQTLHVNVGMHVKYTVLRHCEQVQRYEGASTLYGPHTLGAYIQEFRRCLAPAALWQPRSAARAEFGFPVWRWGAAVVAHNCRRLASLILLRPLKVLSTNLLHGRVAADMVAGRETAPGPAPPDLLGRQLSLFPPVVIDSVPSGASLPDVSRWGVACASLSSLVNPLRYRCSHTTVFFMFLHSMQRHLWQWRPVHLVMTAVYIMAKRTVVAVLGTF